MLAVKVRSYLEANNMVRSASEDLTLWQRHLSGAGPASHKSLPVEESTLNFVQWICFTILFLNEYSELIYISIIRLGKSCPHNRKQFGPPTLNPQGIPNAIQQSPWYQ